MSSIVRKNIHRLRVMGYEVKVNKIMFSDEVIITLRLNSNIGFMLVTSYYELQDDDMVFYIISKFNAMIIGKLRLDE